MRLHFLLLGSAFLLSFCGRLQAAEPSIEPKIAQRLKQLESNLSKVQTLKVNFHQEKQMAILEQKLVLKGRITLQQPDKIAWRVLSPIRYGMVIEGSSLRQWSEETQAIQQFSLASNPVFATAVKQIQSWFSGNYLALTSQFDVVILSDFPLSLQFIPRRGSPSREIIRRIVMYFGTDERFLKSLEVEEIAGDKMTISFRDTSLNPLLLKEEWDPRHE